MSLISDNKKFIFFHLYKCGGTSFRKVITDLKIPTNEWEGVHGLPLDVKTNYKALKQIAAGQVKNDATCVVKFYSNGCGN